MVSTRSHPTSFPPPDLSTPSKPPPPRSLPPRGPWNHTPTRLTLIWLLLSLPLVFWDTAYVLLRPHSMPGGSLHAPIFTPYALYGSVDYIYGEKAWREGNGFTAAQGSLNLLESAGYVGYLWVVWRFGGKEGEVGGGWGGVACLVGFALSVMTLSKTVLYLSNEYFSAFENIGHNDALSLLFLWIIPNGAWIIFPSYMIYTFSRSILHGLSIASGDHLSTPARAVTPTKEE